MNKKVIILLVLISLQAIFAPAVFASSFKDVPVTSRFYESIKSLVFNGTVDAKSEYFHVFRAVNRAEAIKMLLLNTGIADEQRLKVPSFSPFPDVSRSDWYLPYATLAQELGIVRGYSDGTFQGGKTIIFSEALKILFEAYNLDAQDFFVPENTFFDYDPQSWDAHYISSALEYGIITSHEYIRRDRPISRAFFADLLYRFDQYVQDKKTYLNALNQQYTITIPRLGVTDVPLLTTDPFDEDYYHWVLTKGIGHALKYPGETGKVLIYGHSSGYSWDGSPYKQVFRALNQLEDGDEIIVSYLGKTYRYAVNGRDLRHPDDVSVLEDSPVEQLAILTCWPPDSLKNRYLIYAERR
jgi:LPXTG-site transpeptidase (sortase) family protein